MRFRCEHFVERSIGLGGEMWFRRCRVAAAAVTTAEAAVTSAAAPLSNRAKSAVRGVVNMPSRAIAAVLLKAREPVQNRVLYERASEYGFFASHRHFKHVLRMMKNMERVHVIAGPPEKPGGNKLTYKTKLTRRGERIYTHYLGEDIEASPAQATSAGLAEVVSP